MRARSTTASRLTGLNSLPRVHVSATEKEHEVEIAVQDNGIGIDPQYFERIFVIFQRLHERSAYPGTGIGLAMTRKIIEYFGGRIWLDTSYTEGSRFLFTLPMPTETMNESPEDETPDQQTPDDEIPKEADD